MGAGLAGAKDVFDVFSCVGSLLVGRHGLPPLLWLSRHFQGSHAAMSQSGLSWCQCSPRILSRSVLSTVRAFDFNRYLAGWRDDECWLNSVWLPMR